MENTKRNDKFNPSLSGDSIRFRKEGIKYYFESGNPQSCLELVDKKNKIYDSKEYWENGIFKEGGKMFFNKTLNDYQKNGTWILYDNTGKKIGEEDYIKGQMNEERKY